MKQAAKTLNEIRQAGYAALVRELGPAGTVRFLQQFETGSGDYTAGRHKMLGDSSLNELLAQMKKRRKRTA